MKYERDVGRIYQLSFEAVKRECRLEDLPHEIAVVLARIVHACGMPDIVDDLRYTPNFAVRGRRALDDGAVVLCDTRMTATGIMRRQMPPDAVVSTLIDDPKATSAAARKGITRSAAAVELWQDMLDGAVAVIGNAPTALFRLLEIMDETGIRPALIIGFPVGFVGAMESKAELERDPRGAEYITLRGRRGGSGMAAAAVNALCRLPSHATGQPGGDHAHA
ncbi:MAG: precorrin-8X methylmutase [Rhodobacteraceae bacterium]|nr:precorrin-8X methylmutase [Paracoccaceae bacterium]